MRTLSRNCSRRRVEERTRRPPPLPLAVWAEVGGKLRGQVREQTQTLETGRPALRRTSRRGQGQARATWMGQPALKEAHPGVQAGSSSTFLGNSTLHDAIPLLALSPSDVARNHCPHSVPRSESVQETEKGAEHFMSMMTDLS